MPVAGQQFDAVAQSEFSINTLGMGAYRVDGNEHFIGDLLV